MLKLEDHKLHIWHWRPADDDPRAQVSKETHFAWLSEPEKKRYNRLQLADRKLWFLAGKVFVRQVLAQYLGLAPDTLRFCENAWGRPELLSSQLTGPLAFNLSHSGNRFMLAVSRQSLIGADIENSARPRRVKRLVKRYFSSPEADWLLARPGQCQQDGFYALWTLKEAYIKARGMGLALKLDSFSFDLSGQGDIGFTQHDPATALERCWQFWRLAAPEQIAGGQDFHLALAVATDKACQFSLEDFIFTPGQQSDSSACRILAHG